TLDELPRRIDEHLDVRTEPRAEYLRRNAAGDEIPDLALRCARRVLRRDEHRLHARGLVVLVAHAHLRLHVGTKPAPLAGFARLRKAMRQLMRELDRERHELRRLVARVAEHDP